MQVSRATQIGIFISAFMGLNALAKDWPQWRFDAARTGATPTALPAGDFQLQWSRQFPKIKPAFRDVRLQFDSGYEPIVYGKSLLIASPKEDCLISLNTETGAINWRYYTDGPIRFAPVAWQGNAYFGSDDGHLYSVAIETGKLNWKFRAVPSDRKLLGNRRLISTWPIRGGPVLKDGKIYFAAGVWSFEGVFVYSLDAKTGEAVWLNDSCGYIYGIHPHNAEAFGGLAPQGYLLINDTELIVPCSSAYPARFELATGKLIEFKLPAPGRKPGGWFVSTGNLETGPSKLGLIPSDEVNRKRELLYDRSVNQIRHEDKHREEGKVGVRNSIKAGDSQLSFDHELAGLEQPAHTMLIGDNKLFAVSIDGKVLCYSTEPNPSADSHPLSKKNLSDNDPLAKSILESTSANHGVALVIGESSAETLTTLASRTELKIIAINEDTAQVTKLRAAIQPTGVYGNRISVRQTDQTDQLELPPYLADLMVLTDSADSNLINHLSKSVRPFGGKLIYPSEPAQEAPKLPGFSSTEVDDFTVLTRSSLPGSTNYTGDWNKSADELVRAPLGVLWFDDTLGHFKRSPQPKYIDGVMISIDKTWLDSSTRTGKVDYRLKDSVFSDVYTGRILNDSEAAVLRQSFSNDDKETVQPSQYRPPRQKNDWKPEQPNSGTRINPLTGVEEPRVFPKSYGCDGGFDYGNLYTMRSGTAAIYDKRLESGTINLSGPRSGCTNSITPANGVLNVPYFFEGCTCSYPLPTSLSLISMPKVHEQWAAWGDVSRESLAGKIQRIGINFGAPGDRMTDEGTLWLDYPNIGGPSPDVEIAVEQSDSISYQYKHSIWIEDKSETAWPWVVSSSIVGAKSLSVKGIKNGSYTVRLYFSEWQQAERVFDIEIQGDKIGLGFSPVKAAGKLNKGCILTTDRVEITEEILVINLTKKSGETSLSGIEILPIK